MALYKYEDYLRRSESETFDRMYASGATPDHSGVFRCIGCGREVVGEHTRALPAQNHHQHAVEQGQIRWKLIVWPDHNAK